jgi:hypothetical protein
MFITRFSPRKRILGVNSITLLASVMETLIIYCNGATSWTEFRLKSRKTDFNLGTFMWVFLVDQVTLSYVSLHVLRFSVASILHQCTIHSFSFMLVLSEGQAGEGSK